jgi:hypothetical protein
MCGIVVHQMVREWSPHAIAARPSAHDHGIGGNSLASTIEPEGRDFWRRVWGIDPSDYVTAHVTKGALSISLTRLDRDIRSEPVEGRSRDVEQFGMLGLKGQLHPGPQLLRYRGDQADIGKRSEKLIIISCYKVEPGAFGIF